MWQGFSRIHALRNDVLEHPLQHTSSYKHCPSKWWRENSNKITSELKQLWGDHWEVRSKSFSSFPTLHTLAAGPPLMAFCYLLWGKNGTCWGATWQQGGSRPKALCSPDFLKNRLPGRERQEEGQWGLCSALRTSHPGSITPLHSSDQVLAAVTHPSVTFRPVTAGATAGGYAKSSLTLHLVQKVEMGSLKAISWGQHILVSGW